MKPKLTNSEEPTPVLNRFSDVMQGIIATPLSIVQQRIEEIQKKRADDAKAKIRPKLSPK